MEIALFQRDVGDSWSYEHSYALHRGYLQMPTYYLVRSAVHFGTLTAVLVRIAAEFYLVACASTEGAGGDAGTSVGLENFCDCL